MALKTIVICLDGTEPDMLAKWAESGDLPHLQSFLDSGHSYPIKTYPGLGDSVLWSSLITGVHPGRHGHYFPMQYDGNTYTLYRFNQDEQLGAEPFFQYCSKAGARMGIVDVYSAPFRQGMKGVQVQDWLMHDPILEARSWPASLLQILNEKYLHDKFTGTTEAETRTIEESRQLHTDLIERIEAKTAACSDLIKENDWELFCVGYAEMHDLGHQSWHWHDSTCPAHPREAVQQDGDPMLNTLKAIDQGIADILEVSSAENVIILAGLGMAKQCAFNSVVHPILAHFCGMRGTREELVEKRHLMPYFEVPHNMNSAMIRINVKGRESRGMIDQADYDKVCEDLEQKLWQMRDADTGECVIERIINLPKTYPGERAEQLPDLCVEWKKPMMTRAVVLDDGTEFEITADFLTELRQGDHNDHAVFMSNRAYKVDGKVAVEAVAPTVCRTLGINMPYSDAPALELVN